MSRKESGGQVSHMCGAQKLLYPRAGMREAGPIGLLRRPEGQFCVLKRIEAIENPWSV